MINLFLLILSCVIEYPSGLENEPIKVPQFAGATIDKNNEVLILDLVTGKIAGKLNVAHREIREIEDYMERPFGLFFGEDKNIYVYSDYIWRQGLEVPGKIIRIINPEKGKIVKELEIYPRPVLNIEIDKRYKIILRGFTPTEIYTVIDTKEEKVITEKELPTLLYPSSSYIYPDEKKYLWTFLLKGDSTVLTKLNLNLEIIREYPVKLKRGVFLGIKDGFVYYSDWYTLFKVDTSRINKYTVQIPNYIEDGSIINDKLWITCYNTDSAFYKVCVIDLRNFSIIKGMRVTYIGGRVWHVKPLYSPSLRRVFILNSIFDETSISPVGILEYPIMRINDW